MRFITFSLVHFAGNGFPSSRMLCVSTDDKDCTRSKMGAKILTSTPFSSSCGQVGHLAENCGSNERLCFNCGKGGHESSACPDPRTTDQKSCYHCLGKGHIKADCPNLGQKSVAAPSDKPVRGLRNPAAAAAAAGGAANVKPSATGCFVSHDIVTCRKTCA